MKQILFSLILLLFSVSLKGEWEPFDIYRCGAKGLGTGAAFTAIADDVSAIYYNPAGLVQIKTFALFYTFDSQIRILTLIDPTMKLTYKVPALTGFVYPFKDSFNTVLAFSVLSPFQRKIPREFAMYKFAPSLAMQLLDYLSLGINIGFDYTTFGAVNSPDGFGFDFQIGLLYTPSKIVHLGLNYSSPTKINWGTYGIINDLKETFPDILRTGVAVLLTEKLISSFEIEYQNWKSLKYIEDGVDTAPRIKNELFSTIHPHIGIMFLEEQSGAHLRTGLYTDSFFEKDSATQQYVNNTQLIWTIGIGAYALKVLKVEASLADSYLMDFINSKNNRIETVQITVEYRF